jgi:epoxyqueuosine reductase
LLFLFIRIHGLRDIISKYMKKLLKDDLKENGAGLVGFAALHNLPHEMHHSYPTAISIAVPLDAQVISGIINGPTFDYWEEYQRANALLEALAKRTVALLHTNGHQAKWLAPTIVTKDSFTHTSVSYDPMTMSTVLPHKTAATLSGLGWIGKCALLVTKEYGSAIRITTVLTDADLPPGKPIEFSRCGSCTDCVEACPGYAISGKLWTAGITRESFFDAFACRKKAYEQAARIGVHETICGRCIVACPYTQKYLKRAGFPVHNHRA